MVLVTKNSPANARDKRHGFDPSVRKSPLRRQKQLILVFLPGEFYEQRSLASYSLWVHKELDTTELLTLSLHFTMDLNFSKIFLLNISPKRICERPRGTWKKCSTLVATREMEIKSTMRYKLMSLLELWVNKCWYRCGEMKHLCIVMIVNCYSHYRKQ